MKLTKKVVLKFILPILLGIFIVGFASYFWSQTRPAKPGEPRHYIRINSPIPLAHLLDQLHAAGDLKSVWAAGWVARLSHSKKLIAVGTYEVGPGQTAGSIIADLQTPIRRMFRIPDTNWANRTARLLQEHDACSAADYEALVHQPALFKSYINFPDSTNSLEGYLYPDTYDIPPLIGAKPIIEMQLLNFRKKVGTELSDNPNLPTALTIASLIQLESGSNADKPLISAVISNRLKKKMPLQIDASLLYGIDKWRRLTFKDYKTIPGPYNLYTHKGLPPGPICSPTLSSIEAALHPANVNYLYYVAMPDGNTLFASNYQQHLKNVALRIRMLKAKRQGMATP